MDKKLHKYDGFFWLAKDYLLLRIGFALILGFGAVLGVSPVWGGLNDVALDAVARVLISSICVLLVGLLIYLNVKHRIGKPVSIVRKRALWVWVVSLGWMVLAIGIWRLLSWWMIWCFDSWKAVVTGSAALLLALLSQFFFGRGDASMGEPL